MFVGAHPDDESFGPGGTLAKYAAQGVRVVYACATRGEAGTVDPARLGGFATLADKRWAELRCAARALRLADVLHLGYRDSGLPGWSDNRHPRALATVPIDSVVQDVVTVIRDIRPQVVITFDPIGGYYHPDHIAVHHATVRAFRLARDPGYRPGEGTPFAAQKLYYWLPSRGVLRLAVWGLRILGRDPRRAGRNRDVDLTSVIEASFPVHARIRVPGHAVARKHAATVCHGSQIGGPLAARRLAWVLTRCLGATDLYMRAHPEPRDRATEADLFEGIA
jgi:N-acetyl-1-D-myo-inositol-2-amino-2-deoxy-alpha-D-glucopyranoside deacetylase/mycothiol S-conjugate amidase